MVTPEKAASILKDALAEIEAEIPKQEAQKIGQWFNHNIMTFIVILITAGTGMYVIQFAPSKMEELWSKLANVCFFWTAGALYKIFWRGVSNDQGAFINTDPRATAIYISAMLIGTALVIALS